MYISIQKISLPLFFSCTILKKQDNYIAYYKSKKFFFFFKISNDKAMLFKDSCSLSVSSEYFQIKKNVNYTQFLLITLLKSWEMHFFKKFKFKSKGLKIKRKKKKILKFFFWLAHINLAIIRNCKIKRIGKQKYVFISSHWIYLKDICKQMQSIRPNDLFTKKGMRFGRQIILKKRGKKVTYI